MRAVVSIQSTKADGDAQFIKEVFPGLFEQEDEDETGGSHAIVLVSEHCTIFIRPFHTTTSAICCVKDLQVLIISSETVASHIRFQLFDGSQVGELRLPSGAAILIINVDLMQSKSGRRMVSQWLVKPTRQIDINDNPSIAQTPESTLSRLPKFRSLQVALMGASGSTQFALNSRDPVDFETDLFKGRVMCVLRPDDPNDDPYWNERIFSQKKRRMLLNVQGKFKYKPQGIVYAGAEISKPMKLGLVTRGLAGVLLKLVETFISGVHSSFGNGEELAHIVAPAFTFFERLVVTPPGQAPPILDGIIDEPAESLMKRRKSKDTGNWNTIDTYTFSFYSMNISLPTWSLIGLPASGDINLKTFWGDSTVNICMYEKLGSKRQHQIDSKRYVFGLKVSSMLVSCHCCHCQYNRAHMAIAICLTVRSSTWGKNRVELRVMRRKIFSVGVVVGILTKKL
jgi:hypothetical protein